MTLGDVVAFLVDGMHVFCIQEAGVIRIPIPFTATLASCMF
jgi:hypothetical protein